MNRYARHTMVVVTQTNAPTAALRPLSINLSFLNRIPISEATIEYAVTTRARANANWLSCAIFLLCSVALHTGCRLLLVFGSAFGLHLVGHENAIMPQFAFDHGLSPVYKRIGRCVSPDVLNGQSLDFLGLLVLLTDHEIDDLAFALNRAGDHVTSHFEPSLVGLLFRCIQFGHGLVIGFTFLIAGETQVGQRQDDHKGPDKKLKLFAFHEFTPSRSRL